MSSKKVLSVSPWGELLADHYPKAAFESLSAVKPDQGDIEKFVRLWLTEGVPFAFKDRPMIYEALREWIGTSLGVFPKNVSMVGSARLGFSLNPNKPLTTFAIGQSDLDLFVVSEPLLHGLEADFQQWRQDYDAGEVVPRSEYERNLWDANKQTVSRTLPRGFVDANKVPPMSKYKSFQRCQRVGDTASSHLSAAHGSLSFSKSPTRNSL